MSTKRPSRTTARSQAAANKWCDNLYKVEKYMHLFTDDELRWIVPAIDAYNQGGYDTAVVNLDIAAKLNALIRHTLYDRMSDHDGEMLCLAIERLKRLGLPVLYKRWDDEDEEV
jgi:hypothetical protein